MTFRYCNLSVYCTRCLRTYLTGLILHNFSLFYRNKIYCGLVRICWNNFNPDLIIDMDAAIKITRANTMTVEVHEGGLVATDAAGAVTLPTTPLPLLRPGTALVLCHFATTPFSHSSIFLVFYRYFHIFQGLLV